VRLVGVSIVKNEADIIEASIRHNLRYLDRLIVLEHEASDATPQILRALIAEGLPLIHLRCAEPAAPFLQGPWTTMLARQAFAEHSADHVFPLDADEFIHAPSREALMSAIAHAAQDRLMNLNWQTYVYVGDETGHPLHRLRWRVETAKRPLPKIVIPARFAAKRDWQALHGNHAVIWNEGDEKKWDTGTENTLAGVGLAHLPLRSPEQLVAKALISGLARKLREGANGKGTSHSWHIGELYERVTEGKQIGHDEVLSWAIAMYALGRAPAPGDESEYTLVEDPIGDPMPLRYTPSEQANPLLLLAAWTGTLVDQLTRSARVSPESN